MNSDLIKILYNPGSITTAETVRAHNTDALPITGNNTAHAVLAILSRLRNSAADARDAHAQLIALKRKLMLALELDARPVVIKAMRATLAVLAGNFASEVDLFQAFIQNIMLIKDQMDTNAQYSVETARHEWVELECVIFELSRWDDQISYFWAEAL